MDDIKVKIENEVQTILNEKFDNRTRRKIKKYPDRLNFCCPICGDSVDDATKRRGNIYFTNMRYICFNCGYTASVDKFLKEFNMSLSLKDIEVIHDVSARQQQSSSSINIDFQLFKLIDNLAIPVDIIKKQIGLIECGQMDYLKNRCIPSHSLNKFLYKPTTQELFVLNLSPSGKVIGFQIRQLSEKSRKAKYMSYNMGKIYDTFLLKPGTTFNDFLRSKLDQSIDIDTIINKINQLSLIFNILNVTFNRRLNIVEGPIDSMFLDNCVALCGASRLSNYFDEIEDVCYVFDNDETGRKHAFEKLESGKRVFLWGKVPLNNKKIKDINDLVKNGFNIKDIFNDNNTSDSTLDSIYI